MVKSALRLATRLVTTPSYVFGRFRTVRWAYGVSQSVARGAHTPLQVVPLYEFSGEPIASGPSGLVESDLSPADHAARIHRTAWSAGVRLTEAAAERLRSYAHESRLLFRRSASEIGEAASLADLGMDERNRMTTATLTDAWRDPTVRAIAGDPVLLDVIQSYLGYAPRLAMPYFFWSFPSEVPLEERVARNQTVQFHYDVQGLNFAYVSFYLYDTDRGNGAHVLVEGSHNRKRLGHLLGSARLSDEAARDTYGDASIVMIEAPAREGFFEDTSCFHKATTPTDRARLMLQVRYL